MPAVRPRAGALPLLTLAAVIACASRPQPRARRPRRLRPGLDRRLRPPMGRGGGGGGRHDAGRGRQRRDRAAGRAPRRACSRTAPAMVTPGFMDGHLHFIARRLPARQRRPPVGRLTRGVHRPAQGVRARAAAGRVDPVAATGITSAGRARRFPGASGSTRSPRTIPSSSIVSTATWGWPTPPRSGPQESVAPPGTSPEGSIVRDPRTGEPTGILKDAAMDLVRRAIPPTPTPSATRRSPRPGLRGVEGRHRVRRTCPWILPELGAYLRAKRAGTLTARAALYFPIRGWRQVADTVAKLGRGDDWLRIGGVKGFMDGSLGSQHRACSTSPTTTTRATPASSSRAGGFAPRAGSARPTRPGCRSPSTPSATGPTACCSTSIDSVARANGPRDRRFRIEHAQHLRPAGHRRGSRELGVIASMQPYHAIDDGRWAERRIGPERSRHRTPSARCSMPARSWRSARTGRSRRSTRSSASTPRSTAARSTASTRTAGFPSRRSPWRRRCGPTPRQRLRRVRRADPGQAGPGYKADLVLLDQDLTAIPPEAIEREAVRATVVGGRVCVRVPRASHWGESRSQPGWTSVRRAPAQRNGCGLECVRGESASFLSSADGAFTGLGCDDLALGVEDRAHDVRAAAGGWKSGRDPCRTRQDVVPVAREVELCFAIDPRASPAS